MKRNALTLFILFFAYLGFGQIYTEDFTGQNGKGATGPGPTIDITGVSWSIDVTNATLSATSDWFRVENEVFEGRDLDGNAIWISPSINISSFTNVFFTLDASEQGTMEPGDILNTEYRINGGSWTAAATNSTLNDDFTSAIVSQTGLTGNTLEIRVIMNNGADGEYHRIDNIIVDGTPVVGCNITNAGLSAISCNIGPSNDGTDDFITFELNPTGANLSGVYNVSVSGGSITPTSANYGISTTFTLQNGSAGSGNVTVTITDDTDGSCTFVDTIIDPGQCSVTEPVMITQYYEGNSFDKWVEIKNVSNAVVPANTYYIVILNNTDADNPASADPTANGTPSFNNFILIDSDLAIGEVRRYNELGTAEPNYTNTDGITTFNLPNASFSGDDIVMISTTNDNTTWANRIDVIGNGDLWGQQLCFVRKEECSTPAITSTTFDTNDWDIYAFNDTAIVNAVPGTNEYLGQHFRGTTTYVGDTPSDIQGWDNGLPNIERPAVVSVNYDTSTSSVGSFEACSLSINGSATLNIEDGTYVNIQTDLTINAGGTLDVQNEGQLLMVDDTGTVTNNGTTNVRKTTAAMQQFDYVYWSSPVDYSSVIPFPTPIFLVLTEFNANHMYRFNTATFNDLDNDVFDDEQDDWVFFNTDMIPGTGYATMTANTVTGINNAVFTGLVNNGVISVNIGLSGDDNGDADGDEDDWNLIGNPYPSAISADLLVAQNPDINGTLYFWTHNDPISIANGGPDAFNFNTNDYAMYNATGGVGTSALTGGTAPSGFIASGQGFFVDAINTGTVTFNNSMRSSSFPNNDFFRSSEDPSDQNDRIWLNLTNSDGAYSQILIGFIDNATVQKDRLYDGVRLLGNNYIDLYSSDETALQYGIQGRPGFNENDRISLGYNSHLTGNLTIAIDRKEGVLENQQVYLIDKELNITHDLSIPYVFETPLGNFSDRFDLVFTLETLNDDTFEITSEDLQIIDLNASEVKFKIDGMHQMQSLRILDIQGRILYDIRNINASERIFNLSKLSTSTYIAEVRLTNGAVVAKKAVKIN